MSLFSRPHIEDLRCPNDQPIFAKMRAGEVERFRRQFDSLPGQQFRHCRAVICKTEIQVSHGLSHA